MVVGKVVVGLSLATGVRLFHGMFHSLDFFDTKFAKESYDRIKRCVLMAMLVHWCYYRDLYPVEEAVAWFMEYNNQRAKIYGDYYWEPHPCNERYTEELEELGLAFLRKKFRHSNPNAPDLAIVLRGTIPTRWADLKADLRIGAQNFNRDTDRVVRISELILQFCDDNPGKRICMAGHSLGAAIALIVGGCLYSTYDIDIETHLFNPPLLTLVDVARGLPSATRQEDTRRMKLDFPKLKEVLVANKRALHNQWEQFQRLQHWVPKLYLNPGDPFCRQFIDFYKSRGGRPVGRPGDVISAQGLLSGLFSENVTYLKNVVPSADLYISNWRTKPKWYYNMLSEGRIKEFIVGRLPHSLRQWHDFKKEYIELEPVYRARLLR